MSEETAWMRDALCRDLTTEQKDRWFFPDRGAPTGPAKTICSECTVKAECLEYALSEGMKHGIWGGTSERERRAIRKTTTVVRWSRCNGCEKRFWWEVTKGTHPQYCSQECRKGARVYSQRDYERNLANDVA